MKSGLKAVKRFVRRSAAKRSNHCRDEKRTESTYPVLTLSSSRSSNHCRDEKRTESFSANSESARGFGVATIAAMKSGLKVSLVATGNLISLS